MLNRDYRANAWVENEIVYVSKPVATINGLLWSISVQIQSLCKAKWKWRHLYILWSSMMTKKSRILTNSMHSGSSPHLWTVQSKDRITRSKIWDKAHLLKDPWPRISIQEGIDSIRSMILILRGSKCFNHSVSLWDLISINLCQSNLMMKRNHHYHKISVQQSRNLKSLMTYKLLIRYPWVIKMTNQICWKGLMRRWDSTQVLEIEWKWLTCLTL